MKRSEALYKIRKFLNDRVDFFPDGANDEDILYFIENKLGMLPPLIEEQYDQGSGKHTLNACAWEQE
jgi:hypothetical protein